jgi:Phage integrase, N-terminal SAM-like domain
MAIVLPPDPTLGKPKKLLDRVCDVMRLKHYSLRTERTYCDWIERFIRFHELRHAIPGQSGLGYNPTKTGGFFYLLFVRRPHKIATISE